MNEYVYPILTFLGGMLIGKFLPSYIGEKAKNLATKEDIADITRHVETVKNQLSLQADKNVRYQNESTNQLLTFYDEIIEFYHEKLVISFGDFPSDNGESLFEYQKSFRESISNIIKAYQRLLLYFPNDTPLLSPSYKLIELVLEIEKIFKLNFGEIKRTQVAEILAYQQDDKDEYKLAVEKSDQANSNYWSQINPLKEKYMSQVGSLTSSLRNNMKKK